MKTKQEILKMSKREIEEYKWSDEIRESFNDCSYCSDCSDCSGCRRAKGLKYAICNVEFTKKEYEAKIKELNL